MVQLPGILARNWDVIIRTRVHGSSGAAGGGSCARDVSVRIHSTKRHLRKRRAPFCILARTPVCIIPQSRTGVVVAVVLAVHRQFPPLKPQEVEARGASGACHHQPHNSVGEQNQTSWHTVVNFEVCGWSLSLSTASFFFALERLFVYTHAPWSPVSPPPPILTSIAD